MTSIKSRYKFNITLCQLSIDKFNFSQSFSYVDILIFYPIELIYLIQLPEQLSDRTSLSDTTAGTATTFKQNLIQLKTEVVTPGMFFRKATQNSSKKTFGGVLFL